MSADFTRAKELAGDDDVLAEICRAFLVSVPNDLGRLEESVRTLDMAVFKFAIHKLRSSVAIFDGGPLLTDVTTAERAVSSGDFRAAIASMSGWLPQIYAMVDSVRARVNG